MKQRKLVAILAVVLVLVLVAGVLAACNPKEEPTPTPPAADTTGIYDPEVYTYRMGPADIPTSWNFHTYQSNSSTYVLDYSSDSLYTFDYNDDYTGYVIVPSMAAGAFTDVTADYVGKYGIAEGDENRVYSIPLKSNLKFDNGDPITAETFVESMKLLLQPDAANFRADNVYKSGQLKIYGAESYVKQGNFINVDATDGAGVGYGDETWATVSAEAKNTLVFDSELSYVGQYLINRYDGEYTGAQLLANYVLGTIKNADTIETLNGKTLAEILADETLSGLLEGCFEWWCSMPEEEFGFFCVPTEYPSYSWDPIEGEDGTYSEGVGFLADENGNLVVVLKNAMEDNFYLKYELCTSFFLVHPETYRSCIEYKQGVYTNSYGTSVDTYVGFGPYKLTQYLADSTIRLDRNDLWHGYEEGEYTPGTYQTDSVLYTKVDNNATRLEMFLKGELDSYGLQAEDMEDYITSDYVYYNDTESTWYLAMNPSYTTLLANQATATPVVEGNTVIKTVLSIDSFRQALSWSLNRDEFNLTLSPTSGVAKALLSSMIVADPEAGIMYRDTDAAKDAILEYWGLSDKWGEGKEYPDRDAAIASITGYDPNGAKTLFTAAYNEAVELGYITEEQIASGKWEVQLVVGNPVTANFYTNGFEFLKTNWTNAVVGTPFEGHFTFVFSQELGSTSFGTYLRNGSVDLLFGVGYGGSMFDPFSFMDCFTGSLQYDPFTDKNNIDLDITIDLGTGDGELTYRASLYAWVSEALQGNDIVATIIGADGKPVKDEAGNDVTKVVNAGSGIDGSIRTAILAKCETKVLTLSNIFPMQTDASASLRCMRVNYKTENYILGMGRGGIQYYTYAMSDDEFLAHAAAQEGGVLNYKG